MKALKIMREIYRNKNFCDDCGGLDYCSNYNENKICGMNLEIDEAIKELEDIHHIIDSCIEEIEYAIDKPMYSDVYLNNAIRYLKEIKDN